MSGIEVAGLVLGALPVLIEAIDTYRKGITKVKSAIRKRAIIGKLGRALSDQEFIIEVVTKDVLVQSGCDDAAGADKAQLRSLLQDKQTQDMVDSFLGPDYAKKFFDALVDCRSDISCATTRLAMLVPELANVKVISLHRSTDVCSQFIESRWCRSHPESECSISKGSNPLSCQAVHCLQPWGS